jgi:hypothetical protein
MLHDRRTQYVLHFITMLHDRRAQYVLHFITMLHDTPQLSNNNNNAVGAASGTVSPYCGFHL